MNTKITVRTIRWFGAAMCAAAAIAAYAPDSSAAFKRLYATLSLSNPNCTTAFNGETLFAEAWGSDSSANFICNVGTTAGSTAETFCSTSATRHQSYVASINNTTGILTHLQNCALQTTWTNNSQCTYSIPSHGSCVSGDTATATSFGRSY